MIKKSLLSYVNEFAPLRKYTLQFWPWLQTTIAKLEIQKMVVYTVEDLFCANISVSSGLT